MRDSIIKRISVCLMALAVAVSMAGCSLSTDQDRSMEKVRDSGELVLGFDANFPPFGFVEDGGNVEGFDIDLAREVCDRIGVKLVLQPINWDAKLDELEQGRIDCIWNGLSVNKERAELMTLSKPYLRNELIFVVLADSDIRSIDEISGKRVGMQAGSTGLDVFNASDRCSDMVGIASEDNLDLLRKLREGSLDAVLIDSVFAYYCLDKYYSDMRVLPGNLADEEIAVGFRKGDNALKNGVERALKEMKADGTLNEISMRWFGSDVTIIH
ncbi:MAG: amino acid ABC transporter substrate-binding protein [Lachnospiraceae bacterium]|nr:amino acid ABC transporter substrate-binding protein [Lachnospiraceae bacterium]